MRTVALGAVFVGVLLTLPGHPTKVSSPSKIQVIAAHAVSLGLGQPREPSPLPPATLTDVVQRYCVVCHNDQLLTGNQSFQGFDVDRAGEKAEQAEKMIRKLRAGMMPPPGMLRPAGDTLLQLAQTLENKVDEAARLAPNYGERRFARLSQAEYERAIKDLLALDVDAAQWLPPDVLVGSFDNMSAAQALTSTLVDSFVRAAIEVTRLALGNPKKAADK